MANSLTPEYKKLHIDTAIELLNDSMNDIFAELMCVWEGDMSDLSHILTSHENLIKEFILHI